MYSTVHHTRPIFSRGLRELLPQRSFKEVCPYFNVTRPETLYLLSHAIKMGGGWEEEAGASYYQCLAWRCCAC
jgi:hypothetical protein